MRHVQIDTSEPLVFPHQCLLCAEPTARRLPIDPTTGGEEGELALGCLLGAVPLASWITGFVMGHEKRQRRVFVPMCGRCRRGVLLPSAKALPLLLVTAGFLGAMLFAMGAEELLLGGFMFLGFVVSMLVSMAVVGATGGGMLPIQVEFKFKGAAVFRYRIYEGSPYFETMQQVPGAIIVDD